MKEKWSVVGIILLFFGTCLFPVIAQSAEIPLPSSKGNWFYVGGSGPGNYTKIQDAIDNASDGDTVFVYAGTYYEHIIVDKQLVLMGIHSPSEDLPVIDGGDNKTVVIEVDHCVFDSFSVGSDWDYGIFLQSHGSIIRNCSVFKAWGNIKLYHASDNLITKNSFRNSKLGGIVLENSTNNTVMYNLVDNSRSSVVNLGRASCYNLICNNDFSNTNYPDGIINGENCSYNIYRNNHMTNNSDAGFFIISGYGLRIIGNSMNNGISFSSSIPELESYTIENNTNNGRRIYFYIKENDVIVPSDAGQVVLVQCRGFMIRNLTISNIRNNMNVGGGIYLINSSQTTLQGTKISTCSPSGICLIDSNDNMVSSNNLSNNYHGIYCERSSRNVISENIIKEGGDEGIHLLYSSRNTIRINAISGYTTCVVLSASHFNNIDNNTIKGNVVLLSVSECNQITQNHIQGGVEINFFSVFNTVSGNKINNSDCGIFLNTFSNSNRFFGNNITNNDVGVVILNCRLNIFKRNNFIRNSVHVYFEDVLFFSTLPDLWRRNYWDDLHGVPLKRIEGTMTILQITVDPEYPPPPIVLKWWYFDWFPALKPYAIG